MGRRSDPRWRDGAARELVVDRLEGVRPGRALLMLERGDEIRLALEESGGTVTHWDRRVGGKAGSVSAWPPEGTFDWIGLRLPQAADELRMMASVAASRLASGGRLWVYGAKDEGIESVKNRLAGVFGSIVSSAIGGRCRIIEARDPAAGVSGGLPNWAQEFGASESPQERWVSFPGCFAHGRVDRGTALLLSHLPKAGPGVRVLDFGCGTGMIARAIRAGSPEVEITLLDNDALSLEAAVLNVPGANPILSEGLTGIGSTGFDWIISNPPYHVGKAGTSAVFEDLCRHAPDFLRAGGALLCVVQTTHALGPLLKENFHTCSVIAETPQFRVWKSLTTP